MQDASSREKRGSQRGFEAVSTDHWLPDCLCAPLHAECLACHEQSSPLPSTGSNPHSVRMKLADLERAAQRKCWFCSVIFAGVKNMPAWDPHKPMPNRTDFDLESSGSGISLKLLDVELRFPTLLPEPTVSFYIDAQKEVTSPCKLLQLRQETIYSDPEYQMQFISRALQNCLQNHSCAPKPSTFMPTRLIRIQTINDQHAAFLVENIDLAPYVTLSHCWGPSFPAYAKTTSLNLEARLSPRGIPWEELPQTFRDAMITSKRLGFEYIWIDALCIIQDSSSDWETEAMLMSEVYSCGAVMLSSDASPDTNVGFFRSKNMASLPWSVPDQELPIKAQFNLIHKTFGMMQGMYSPFDQSHIYPLSTRAWCYQEGRLARRVVHFQIDEVSYDCINEVECHCGYWGPSGRKYGINAWYKTLPDNMCTMEEKYTLWRNTVTMYSERRLTFLSDRFPAFSALARQFDCSVGNPNEGQSLPTEESRMFREIDLGEYVAGFWSKFLMQDLYWFANFSPGVRTSTASNYVAPSWSWASVTGSVNWVTKGALDAVLVHVHHVLAGSDKFGQLAYAELVLEAKIIPVSLCWEIITRQQTKEMFIDLQCQDPDSGSHACLGAYRPDYYVPQPDMKYFSGYILSKEYPGASPDERIPLTDGEYFALLFGQTDVMIIKAMQDRGPGVYERTGTVHTHRNMPSGDDDMSHWFKGVERQVVKII